MKLRRIREGLLDRQHGSKTVRVYHGTSSLLLPSIAKYGLLCGDKLKLKGLSDPNHCDALSVTTDIEYTKQWSEEAVDFGPGEGGEEVILRMDVPRGRLRVNRENMAYTEPKSATHAAYVKPGFIPPEDIIVMFSDGREVPILKCV